MRYHPSFFSAIFLALSAYAPGSSAWASEPPPLRNFSYHCELSQPHSKDGLACRVAGVICNNPVEPLHDGDHPPGPTPPPVDRCEAHTLHIECGIDDFLHVFPAEVSRDLEDLLLAGKEFPDPEPSREAALRIAGFNDAWGAYESRLEIAYPDGSDQSFEGTCTVAGLPGEEHEDGHENEDRLLACRHHPA